MSKQVRNCRFDEQVRPLPVGHRNASLFPACHLALTRRRNSCSYDGFPETAERERDGRSPFYGERRMRKRVVVAAAAGRPVGIASEIGAISPIPFPGLLGGLRRRIRSGELELCFSRRRTWPSYLSDGAVCFVPVPHSVGIECDKDGLHRRCWGLSTRRADASCFRTWSRQNQHGAAFHGPGDTRQQQPVWGVLDPRSFKEPRLVC